MLSIFKKQIIWFYCIGFLVLAIALLGGTQVVYAQDECPEGMVPVLVNGDWAGECRQEEKEGQGESGQNKKTATPVPPTNTPTATVTTTPTTTHTFTPSPTATQTLVPTATLSIQQLGQNYCASDPAAAQAVTDRQQAIQTQSANCYAFAADGNYALSVEERTTCSNEASRDRYYLGCETKCDSNDRKICYLQYELEQCDPYYTRSTDAMRCEGRVQAEIDQLKCGDDAWPWLCNLGPNIMEGLLTASVWVGAAIAIAYLWTKGAVNTAWNWTKDTVDTAWNWSKGAGNSVANTAENTADTVSKTAQDAANTVSNTTEKAVNTVVNTANTVANTAQNAVNTASNTAQNAANTVSNTAEKAASTVADTAKDATETAEKGAKKVGKAIKKLFKK